MEGKFIKITNILYGVLNTLPESDPLKNRAKDKALVILENLTLLDGAKSWELSQKEKALVMVLSDIEILESYLTIGKSQGWITDLNFLIIIKEYRNVYQEIKSSKVLAAEDPKIAQIFVNDDRVLHDKNPKVQVNSIKPIIVKAQIKEQEHEKYSQRQERILQILGKQQKAQVADLIKELPKITKRTVRRDLDDLLKKGKVVRVGAWNQVFYQISKSVR